MIYLPKYCETVEEFKNHCFRGSILYDENEDEKYLKYYPLENGYYFVFDRFYGYCSDGTESRSHYEYLLVNYPDKTQVQLTWDNEGLRKIEFFENTKRLKFSYNKAWEIFQEKHDSYNFKNFYALINTDNGDISFKEDTLSDYESFREMIENNKGGWLDDSVNGVPFYAK